ncbi:MAG: ADP-ribosylation factor-like protein [Promethearchaeota archaeon]
MVKTKEKVAFLGMNNAGKTSIIKTLMQQFDILESIKPTIKVERSFFEFMGKDLIFWDFGGQQKYRKDYLAEPERFFDEISYLFYVVDVLDAEIFEETLVYFKKVVHFLEMYSKDASIILFFHKHDADKKDIIDTLDLKTKFLKESQAVLEHKMARSMTEKGRNSIYIYNTTIYDPINIVKACSEPFLSKHDLIDVVSDILSQFVTNFKLEFATLFTSNHFELGNFLAESLDINDMNDILNQYLRAINPDPDLVVELTFLRNHPYKLAVSGFSITHQGIKIPFYSVIIYRDQNGMGTGELKEIIEKQNQNLKKLIVNADLVNIYMKSKNKY